MKPIRLPAWAVAAGALWLAGQAPLALAQAQTLTKGQQFYQKICAKCHEVGIGPVLLGRQLPEATVVYFARHGNGPMPAFRATDIDDAALKELAAFVNQSAVPAKK